MEEIDCISETPVFLHASIHEYSPNRFVGKNLVHWAVLRQAKLLAHLPEDSVHKRTIL